MKRIILIMGALAASVLAVSSCKCNPSWNVSFDNGKTVRCYGDVDVRNMELRDFDKIVLNGSADITLVQSDGFQVTVKANKDVFDYLDYRVEDGTLLMETKDKVNIKAETFDVTIGMPVMLSVVVNGAGDIDQKTGYSSTENLSLVINGAGDFDFTGLRVPDLSVTVNGAGDIDLNDIDVKNLTLSVNGAGDAVVSGKTDVANLHVAGVGAINATELEAGQVNTSKSGVASIKTK